MRIPLRLSHALAIAAWIGVAGASFNVLGETSMPALEIKTLCIGRFTVDLPAEAEAAIYSTYQRMESQKISRTRDFDYLKQQLTSRALIYKATRMQRTPDSDSFWRSARKDPDLMYAATQLVGFEVDPALQQAVLAYHPDLEQTKIVTELHKVMGNEDFIFTYESIGAHTYQEARGLLWNAGTTFQAVARGARPQGPGFCLEGGMFANDGKPPVHESLSLVATFPEHPDARFIINARAISKVNQDEPSLKFRVDSELGILRATVPGHVSVLTRGPLKAAGQDGFQIGVAAPYGSVPNARIRKFFWSADGVPNDVTRPFMEMELIVQPTRDGPITIESDEEAQKLWDQLIQGVRIRPGAAG